MSLWGEALRSPARSDVAPDDLASSVHAPHEAELLRGTVVVPESLDLLELQQRSSRRQVSDRSEHAISTTNEAPRQAR